MSQTLPRNVINPFSEKFLETWQLWKDFRWEEHRFKYKGVISEQARLAALCQIAEGQEELAVAIILQSIENAWKGLYPLKNNKTINGKQAASIRESVTDELNKRFASRK